MKATLIFLVLCPTVAPSDGPYRSETANRAIKEFQKTLKKVSERSTNQILHAKKRLLQKLESAKEFTTKAGDLDEAIKLKKAIELLNKDIKVFAINNQEKAAVNNQRNAAVQNRLTIAGTTWEYHFPKDGENKNNRTMTFHADGTITDKFMGKTYRGTYSKRGNQWLVDMKDRDTNVITIVGTKIFLEHWRQEQIGHAHAVASGWKVK